ncbi:MAG TPA: hypothetical protein VIM11_09815 [Tepidisphaeraceae bacterium]
MTNRQFLLRVFGLSDLVSQLGGSFVVFALDGAPKFLSKSGEIDLPLHRNTGPATPGGHFSDVMRGTLMGTLKKRRQVALKNAVIVGTAQQTVLAEFSPGDAAILAARCGFFLKIRVLHDEVGQQLVNGHVAFDRQAFVLRGALLTQMFLDLFAAFDLGQMYGGGFIAVITLHRAICLFLRI